MRIAVHHPSASSRLGRVLADGLRAALAAQGHDARLCDDSQDVIAAAPDLVMVVDPACPKLTDHFTLGFVWEPFATVERRADWHLPIASWDLAVCTSPEVRHFLRDMQWPARHSSAVSEAAVHPAIALGVPKGGPPPPTVAVFCDTPLFESHARHRELFAAIARRVPLQAYGPDELWDFLGPSHAGPAPDSMAAASAILARHRAVMAFSQQPCEPGQVDTTAFLAAGAGRFVILNADTATADLFGSAGLRVDLDHDPSSVADRIAAALDRAAPRAGLPAGLSLADQLPPLLAEVSTLRGRPVRSSGTVSVIIRCGGRPLDFVRRAVETAARQSYKDIGLVFVAYTRWPEIEAYAAKLGDDPRWAFVRSLSVPGGNRSATLWAALATIDTPFFTLLDDDDEWFHDHVASLAAALDSYKQAMVAHSGTVRVEEWCFPPDPANPPPRQERRALLYLTPFDVETAIRLDHRVQSNAWLARRDALCGPVLDDPGLNYSEDLYLFMAMVARHPYVFTGRATAVYNWRTGQADSSRAEPLERCAHQQRRMLRRLQQLPFHPSALGASLYRRSTAAEPEGGLLTGPVHYESSLADGIDFGRIGLPGFVAGVSGLSYREVWGRWTVGPQLRLDFRGSLPDTFRLKLRGHASEHNAGRRFTITAGACTRQITLPELDEDVEVAFAGTGEPRRLTFDIPYPTAPNAMEVRLIGLGLVRLSIVADG